MRVRVVHNIDDLARDLQQIRVRSRKDMSRIVNRMATEGNREARRIAQAKAGPHGASYWKRLKAEKTGPLTAEYGPVGIPKTDFVGVGFRNGPANNDLPQSADLIGPRFADEVREAAGRWFW